MRLDNAQRKDGILGEIGGDFPMDEAVMSAFPKVSRVISTEVLRDAVSTQTGRITVELSSGDVRQYFIKVVSGDLGQQLVRGEFTALVLIDQSITGLVPKPLACGEYNSSQNKHFLIEDFHNMDMSVPSPTNLVLRVLQLYSQVSANGMFGFAVTTFDGICPQSVDWEQSWTKFFTRLLRNVMESNVWVLGVWPELSTAMEQLLTFVLPRLLNPLQEGPNPIIPRLIHGDLWSGNIGMHKKFGEVIFVDPGCFYAHNEMDIHTRRRYGV